MEPTKSPPFCAPKRPLLWTKPIVKVENRKTGELEPSDIVIVTLGRRSIDLALRFFFVYF